MFCNTRTHVKHVSQHARTHENNFFHSAHPARTFFSPRTPRAHPAHTRAHPARTPRAHARTFFTPRTPARALAQKVCRIIYLLKYPHHLPSESARAPGRTAPIPPPGARRGRSYTLFTTYLPSHRTTFTNQTDRNVCGRVAGGAGPSREHF
jgi:hypothetical protein